VTDEEIDGLNGLDPLEGLAARLSKAKDERDAFKRMFQESERERGELLQERDDLKREWVSYDEENKILRAKLVAAEAELARVRGQHQHPTFNPSTTCSCGHAIARHRSSNDPSCMLCACMEFNQRIKVC
jgi:hypothetical protein